MKNNDIERKIHSILRIIADSSAPIGSKEISKKLKGLAIDLTERAIRYHLKIMDERGLTEVKWKEGRIITEKGLDELDNGMVHEKVGMVISKIENISCMMDFDLSAKSGKVILNISYFPAERYKEALKIMRPVFDRKYSMGVLVTVAEEGEKLGGVEVPKGEVGFGTLCSVNFNGILLKHGIPVESKFAGVLEVADYRPLRFTDLVSYAGTTLDPLEIFIKSRMTDISRAVNSGSGKIMASFREIPAASLEAIKPVLRRIEDAGLGAPLIVGRPGHSLLGIPVGMERIGMVVPGGLNPQAALEEKGIATKSRALVTMMEYKELKIFWDLL